LRDTLTQQLRCDRPFASAAYSCLPVRLRYTHNFPSSG